MQKQKILAALVVIVIMMVASACSVGPSRRSAELTPGETGGVRYSESSVGILTPTTSPESMARAERGLAEAELTRSMAAQVEQGRAGEVAGSHQGVLINQDNRRTVYLYHPTRNIVEEIRPSEALFFFTTHVPDHLNIRWSGDDRLYEQETFKESGVYSGRKIDFGARVWYD